MTKCARLYRTGTQTHVCTGGRYCKGDCKPKAAKAKKLAPDFSEWKVNGSQQSTAIWVEDKDGFRVATVKNHEHDLDVARLIAAAPKLKAALEAMAAEAAIAATRLRAIHKEVMAAGVLDEAIAMASAALRMANYGAPDEGRR